jgi:hypothetical protein
MGAYRLLEVALKAGALAGLGLAIGAASGPGPVPGEAAKVSRADFAAADGAPGDPAALNRLLAALPQVTFDDNGTTRHFYVWEGDMLLDREDVAGMIFARHAREGPARAGELLLQLRDDGQPGVWSRTARSISYAIDCSTFPSAGECAETTQAMATATHDWEAVCPSCQVKFHRVNATPGIKPGNGGAPTFVVRYNPDAADYIAISFFANDPAYKRYLLVTHDYFTSDFSKAGVLRHELGHVLGYRHEHNRAPGGCVFEDNRWKPLTPYDPHSVMHYFCGGGGTMTLALTDSDRAGHRTAYKL